MFGVREAIIFLRFSYGTFSAVMVPVPMLTFVGFFIFEWGAHSA